MVGLLVSDNESKTAGATIRVGVGSLDEPDNLNGLAHFLEHMLFLGSKKYSEENVLDKYLSKRGGSSNAFTSNEKTVYFFVVENEGLDKALDIFSEFFKEPLLSESGIMREVNAVHSEYIKNF